MDLDFSAGGPEGHGASRATESADGDASSAGSGSSVRLRQRLTRLVAGDVAKGVVLRQLLQAAMMELQSKAEHELGMSSQDFSIALRGVLSPRVLDVLQHL